MEACTKWRIVFWLLVAFFVASAVFAAMVIYAGLRPAACCGSSVCEVQKHHIRRNE